MSSRNNISIVSQCIYQNCYAHSGDLVAVSLLYHCVKSVQIRSKSVSQSVSQSASQPASQPVSQSVRKEGSKQTSQQGSKEGRKEGRKVVIQETSRVRIAVTPGYMERKFLPGLLHGPMRKIFFSTHERPIFTVVMCLLNIIFE